MRDKYYKVKSFRLEDGLYEELKSAKGEVSWNIFFKQLLKLNKKYE